MQKLWEIALISSIAAIVINVIMIMVNFVFSRLYIKHTIEYLLPGIKKETYQITLFSIVYFIIQISALNIDIFNEYIILLLLLNIPAVLIVLYTVVNCVDTIKRHKYNMSFKRD